MALAKSLTCLGLTTTTGSPAALKALATAVSYPPVASSTMSAGVAACIASTSATIPAASLPYRIDCDCGMASVSSHALLTSIPTNCCSMLFDPSLRSIRDSLPSNRSGLDNDSTMAAPLRALPRACSRSSRGGRASAVTVNLACDIQGAGGEGQHIQAQLMSCIYAGLNSAES